jgi:DNA modification methylase
MLNAGSRLHFGGDSGLAPDLLVQADNRAVLAGMADRTVDLVYVDPPFGTGAVRRGRGAAFRDVAADPEGFVAWLAPCLAESRRVLAEHGSLFVHLDYRTVHYVKIALDRLFGAGRLVNEIVWCYSVGGKSRRSFGRKHDTILWYARGRDHAFFPEAVRVPRKPRSHMRAVRGPDGGLVQEKTDRRTGKVYRYPVEAGKVPEDWWTDIETLNRGDRERTGWPTQKPERLLERIVRAASAPGARVADWFAGSGTTAVVAQRLGRRFVAVDRERPAVELAAARLERSGLELAAAGRPPRDIELLCSQRDGALAFVAAR